MMSKWGDLLILDPYYNPCLSLTSTTFDLDYAKPDAFVSRGWQRATDEVIGPMYRGRIVGQEFVATQDGVCAVGVAFATYGRRCRGRVHFLLEGSDWTGPEEVTVEIDAEDIADNELYIFQFDPIPDSDGQRFSFRVEFVPSARESQLTIWRSSQTDERFGPYLENRVPAIGTLSFRWFTLARPRAAPLGTMTALESALA